MPGIDLISDFLFHWESSLQAVMFILPPPKSYSLIHVSLVAFLG